MSFMIVDLRSDTVTRPTPEMYDAMVKAKLDDDVLGHDPTTLELERLAAKLVGKEDAIFVPSGTMGNQIALATHTRPGDSVLFDDDAHMLFYECAATAVVSGVQVRTFPSVNGIPIVEKLKDRILKRSHHTPGTTLICLENSHNRAGGTVVSVEIHRQLSLVAKESGLKVHLDGARLFNAAVALGVSPSSITAQVDSVNFCLSKGLGSPIGSVLCGPAEFIESARFWRKRFGGGMRQSGILAACGIVSLTKMVDRLAVDHQRAKTLAESLDKLPGIQCVAPQTNILMIDTEHPASQWVDALEKLDVHTVAMGEYRIRCVFHFDITDEGLEQTRLAFQKVSDSGLR